MFERFTAEARSVVSLAEGEARSLNHEWISTEHLLLGLLGVGRGVAARVLASFDVGFDEVREEVIRIAGEGDEVVAGEIPFAPRGAKVLDLAALEADGLGERCVDTAHILLGLIGETEGVAPYILLGFGADPDAIRLATMRLLEGRG